MARNNPVIICIIRQSPRREPNFHHIDKFLGEGRSIRDPLIILNKGCVFRIGPIIVFFIYNDFLCSVYGDVYGEDFSFL